MNIDNNLNENNNKTKSEQNKNIIIKEKETKNNQEKLNNIKKEKNKNKEIKELNIIKNKKIINTRNIQNDLYEVYNTNNTNNNNNTNQMDKYFCLTLEEDPNKIMTNEKNMNIFLSKDKYEMKSEYNNSNKITKKYNHKRIIKQSINQIELHPYAQRKGIVKLCEENNIKVEAWYPIAHGDKKLINNEEKIKMKMEKFKKKIVIIIII